MYIYNRQKLLKKYICILVQMKKKLFIHTLVRMAPGPDGTTPADHTVHSSGIVNVNIKMSIYYLTDQNVNNL